MLLKNKNTRSIIGIKNDMTGGIKMDERVKADYKELIVETVRDISDDWILQQIYRYICSIVKEG